MKTLNIRELDSLHGDRRVTLTMEEEVKELNFKSMVTILSNGKVVHSPDELLQAIMESKSEEVEAYRFPLLAGG